MIRRGLDTRDGEAGYCSNCDRDMPAGPDICLGWIPGVAQACCGHGRAGLAYVVIGHPPELANVVTRRNTGGDERGLILYGANALAFFALARDGATVYQSETERAGTA